jgi:hypothetical protein
MTKPTQQPPIKKPHAHYTIHVSPQVRKFMLKNFAYYNGVFRTEEWSTLGSLVTLCLIDNRAWKDRHLTDDYLKENETQKIIVELTTAQMKMTPRIFKLPRINTEINRLFKEHMVTWIRSQYEIGVSAHQACRSFLEYYNLDPGGKEYNLDNAYKAWQRSKKSNETEL